MSGRALLTRRFTVGRAALVVWSGFFVPLLLLNLLTQRWGDVALLLGQWGVVFLATLTLRAPRRAVIGGLFTALLALTITGFVEQHLATTAWTPHAPGLARRVGFDLAGSISAVSGSAEHIPSSRSWHLAPGTDALRLEFSVRSPQSALRDAPSALLQLDWPRRVTETPRALHIPLTPRWQSHSLEVRSDDLGNAPSVRAYLHAEAGSVVEVAAVRLISLGESADPRPVTSGARQRFLFDDPNLAGHSIAMTGLVLLALLRRSHMALLAVLLTLTSAAFTGSRIAWGVALVGLLALLWPLGTPRQRLLMLAALLGSGLLLALGLEWGSFARLQSLAMTEVASRPEIWRVAWQALMDHPWTGLGGNFAIYWQAHTQGSGRNLVTHAHNFWLATASHYGVLGLLASLWLGAGLVYLAWRTGRWRGFVVVGALLALNVFDHTLFYAAVLFPVLLALNHLALPEPER